MEGNKIDNLKTIIVYTSMIDNLISQFTLEESNNAINDIKRVSKKFMKQRQRTNNKTFYQSIVIGTKAWTNSINYYAEKDYKIDVYSLINGLWCEKEELFKKFTNISHKRIEKLLLTADGKHTTESELQAYEIAKYLINQIDTQMKEKQCQ